ncbi:MAG: hypothetical protein BWY82_02196 [Verrucomicrobia bacterium ADurb.Bin474]|nr:MAG: hypothetical protein BWY82_02196 [Verrucomicrobia bacterium ADurb.Bin474]
MHIAGGGPYHGQFLLIGWIVHPDVEHETVQLGFGQGIGAFLLDRILGRHHQEHVGERKCLISDRDLTFLHPLEERALHFCRGAVDFVSQHKIRENRTLFCDEIDVLRVVDLGSDDVRRQHIRGELNASEVRQHGACKCFERQCLGETRYPFKQNVSVCQQRDDQALDQMFLPNDVAMQFLLERSQPER